MNYTIKSIWGLAKSKELNLSDTTLYDIVHRETGKTSIRKLTNSEIERVCKALSMLKKSQKKPDNHITGKQRWLILKLEEELGWKDNPKRLRSFMEKYCRKSNINWLTNREASNLIEGLKGMQQRRRSDSVGQEEVQASN